MGNVVCKKCGAEAHSKCPACRTVFPEDQIGAMLSWILKFKERKMENGQRWLEVSLLMTDEQDEEKALENLAKLMEKMLHQVDNYPSIHSYACDHEWTMKPGEKPTIDCGHFG